MIILTIRTDKPEAEIGLYNADRKLKYITWAAHRELSNTILSKIEELLQSQQRKLEDVEGIVCFEGPGSFTGLRIGMTVANTLAYSLNIPIVAAMEANWIALGFERLRSGEDDRIALPHYGSAPHITQQKK